MKRNNKISTELLNFRLRVSNINVQNELRERKEMSGMSYNKIINVVLENELLKGNQRFEIKDVVEQNRVLSQRLNQHIKSSKNFFEINKILIETNQSMLAIVLNLLKEQLKDTPQGQNIILKLERGLFSLLPDEIEKSQIENLKNFYDNQKDSDE